MTGLYVKLDASYHLDDKVADLTYPESELMWVRILCHCKRLGNDGFVHRNLLASIAPPFEHISAQDMADDLANTGLLTVVDRGWMVTKWLKHNESPEEIDAKRQAAALRTARWRERKRDDTVTRHTSITSSGGDVSTPHRQRHQPEPEPEPVVRRARASKRSRLAADAALTDALRGIASEHRVDADTEWPKFVAHHQAKGSVMADWTAAWRTWVLRAPQFGGAVVPMKRTGTDDRAIPLDLSGEDDPW